MEKANFSINLVRKKLNFIDQFIKWSLSIGRGLVIAVEIVALSTFLYRFGLDRQIIDTRDKIQQQQAIVAYLKNREDQYRNLQERLILAKSLSQNSENVAIIQKIVSLAPPDMVINSISFSEGNISVNADVLSVTSLTSFVDSLKSYKPIASISVDKIENRTSTSSINVSITCSLQSTQNAKI